MSSKRPTSQRQRDQETAKRYLRNLRSAGFDVSDYGFTDDLGKFHPKKFLTAQERRNLAYTNAVYKKVKKESGSASVATMAIGGQILKSKVKPGERVSAKHTKKAVENARKKIAQYSIPDEAREIIEYYKNVLFHGETLFAASFQFSEKEKNKDAQLYNQNMNPIGQYLASHATADNPDYIRFLVHQREAFDNAMQDMIQALYDADDEDADEVIEDYSQRIKRILIDDFAPQSESLDRADEFSAEAQNIMNLAKEYMNMYGDKYKDYYLKVVDDCIALAKAGKLEELYQKLIEDFEP